jgi:hypothetical protein
MGSRARMAAIVIAAKQCVVRRTLSRHNFHAQWRSTMSTTCADCASALSDGRQNSLQSQSAASSDLAASQLASTSSSCARGTAVLTEVYLKLCIPAA